MHKLTQISRADNRDKIEECNLNELWKGVRSGRKKALSDLFCTSYSWLFNYGYRIVPREAFVEDAIQELFLILWEKREAINEAQSVKSYLCSSLRRLIFRRIQKQKNRAERNYTYKQTFSEDLHTIEELLIYYEIDQERRKRLSVAIGLLSDRQKEAIVLKFFNGFSSAEIAQIMEINKQSVYNHVSTAINKMQDIFNTNAQGSTIETKPEL